MATLPNLLGFHLPMGKTHQQMGIDDNPLLKALATPEVLAGLAAGGAGLGAIMGRRALREGVERGGKRVAKGMAWGGKRPKLFHAYDPREAMRRNRLWKIIKGKQDIDDTASVLNARGTKGGDMDVLYTSDTPIYDWDLGPYEGNMRNVGQQGGVAHPSMGDDETVQSLDELLELLRARTSRLEARDVPSNMAVYLTPGGYRGIEKGVHAAPKTGLRGAFDTGHIDSAYKRMSQMPGGITSRPKAPRSLRKQTPMFTEPAYRARVGPKPERNPDADWVAGYVGTVGRGKPSRSAQRIVREGHDDLITKQGLRQGTPQMDSFLQAVSKEIQQLGPEDANHVVQNLARRYGIPISAIPSLLMAGGIGLGQQNALRPTTTQGK